jgi:hypothetical protein
LHLVPTAVLKLAPVTVRIATIGVTVSTGIDIIALFADETLAALINQRAAVAATSDPRCIAGTVGKAFGAGPIIAALYLRRSPVAINA